MGTRYVTYVYSSIVTSDKDSTVFIVGAQNSVSEGFITLNFAELYTCTFYPETSKMLF